MRIYLGGPHPRGRLISWFWGVAISLLLSLAAMILALVCSARPSLLEEVSFSRRVYDRNGELLRLTLADDEKYRVFVPFRELSPQMVEATLLYEDSYFYWHPGMNPVALAKALWNEATGTGHRFGASTITMQLARIRFHLNTRSWTGKLMQIARAIQLEWYYSKQEILEAYFSLVSYGGNIEGVGAAGLVYFHQPPDRLTLGEALTLSVIPQNPAERAPLRRKVPGALVAARQRLFSKWLSCHQEAMSEKSLVESELQIKAPKDLPFLAPHFVDDLLNDERGDLTIRTTLDLSLQRLMERIIHSYIEDRSQIGIQNAAALLVDRRTMDVLAAVGSADYFDEKINGQVNGTRMKRSPGSTLKPFVYALAMEQGLIHPLSLLRDTPTSFHDYNPENFDHGFVGPIRAKDALIQSRNVPAVMLAARLRQRSLYRFLKEAGVAGLKEESFYGLTLALGGAEITMEELVQLYAMLANDGIHRPLRKRDGARVRSEVPRLGPEACFLTLEILRECSRPDALACASDRTAAAPVCWKTGTSFSYRDAWTVGVFDNHILAVWVGNFDGLSNPGLVGRTAAAPLFFQLVDVIRPEQIAPARESENPRRNLKRVEFCSVSGQLLGPHCPHPAAGWFIPGVSPITICDVHREVWINPITGLRMQDGVGSTHAIREVYEFWPSDLLASFKQAGIPRRVPPPYAADVPLEEKMRTGEGPVIASPREGVVYSLRLADKNHPTIPLQAIIDASAEKVYWFANRTFLGSTNTDMTMDWQPGPGIHDVTVTDDHGRSASRRVRVEMVE